MSNKVLTVVTGARVLATELWLKGAEFALTYPRTASAVAGFAGGLALGLMF